LFYLIWKFVEIPCISQNININEMNIRKQRYILIEKVGNQLNP
jgi:hypothetical protein